MFGLKLLASIYLLAQVGNSRAFPLESDENIRDMCALLPALLWPCSLISDSNRDDILLYERAQAQSQAGTTSKSRPPTIATSTVPNQEETAGHRPRAEVADSSASSRLPSSERGELGLLADSASHRSDISAQKNTGTMAPLNRRMPPNTANPASSIFPRGLARMTNSPQARLEQLKDVYLNPLSDFQFKPTLHESKTQSRIDDLNRDILMFIPELIGATIILSWNTEHLYVASLPEAPFFSSPHNFERAIEFLRTGDEQIGDGPSLFEEDAGEGQTMEMQGATTRIITVGNSADFADLEQDGPTRAKHYQKIEQLQKLCKERLGGPTEVFVYTLPRANVGSRDEIRTQMSIEFSHYSGQLRVLFTDDRWGNNPRGAYELTEPNTLIE